MTALVLGADSGLLAVELERMGENEDVIVMDGSAARLEALEDQVADPRVWFMIGDAEVIPLPDGAVDEVVGADASPEVARVTR
jgi:ubiquinone/menaquinone biosynthesis C-methylase UbiE